MNEDSVPNNVYRVVVYRSKYPSAEVADVYGGSFDEGIGENLLILAPDVASAVMKALAVKSVLNTPIYGITVQQNFDRRVVS